MDLTITEWGNTGHWQIFIGDMTTGQYYQNIFSYTPDMKYAEWIEERTKLQTDWLANFGTAHFGPHFTGSGNNPNQVQDAANGVYYNVGQLPNYEITMYNTTTDRNLAVPGPLYPTDSFNVTFVNSH